MVSVPSLRKQTHRLDECKWRQKSIRKTQCINPWEKTPFGFIFCVEKHKILDEKKQTICLFSDVPPNIFALSGWLD